MSETLPNIEAQLTPDVLHMPMRTINIGNFICETNVPEGVNLFNFREYSKPTYADLHVCALDEMAVGEYQLTIVAEMDASGVWEDANDDYTRKIEIVEGEKGKVFTDSNQVDELISEGTQKIHSALGYSVAHDNPFQEDLKSYWVTGTPTPETLKSAASLLGVKIKLISDFDESISGPVYLEVFADGYYPVATKNDRWYSHDITDDHITAMVLGGEPLKLALQTVAKGVLKEDDQERIKDTAEAIDKFTGTLRGVVANSDFHLQKQYSNSNGMATLYKAGFELGLDAETIETILTKSQENAEEFGMTVKELEYVDPSTITLEPPELDFV